VTPEWSNPIFHQLSGAFGSMTKAHERKNWMGRRIALGQRLRLEQMPRWQPFDWDQTTTMEKIVRTHLFYPSHLPLLLIGILLLLLTRLVEATHETLDVALVSKTVLMMLSGRDVVRYIDVAILAKVAFLGDPIFTHCSWEGREGERWTGHVT
jgi:hypothetical protein